MTRTATFSTLGHASLGGRAPLFALLLVCLVGFGCAEGKVSPCDGAQCLDQIALPDAPGDDTSDTAPPEDTTIAPDTQVQPDTIVNDTLNDTTDTTVADTTGPDTTVEDVEPEVTEPPILGLRCGVDEASGCVPSAAEWPGCTVLQCPGGECSLLGDSGFCTPPCATDADCANVHQESVVGTQFSCVADAVDSYCVPGSNAPCNHDGECPSGEVCKIGYVESNGEVLVSTVCQTATSGGGGPGAPCNVDPTLGLLSYCANDLCLGSVCGAFCDTGDATSCGVGALECLDNVELADGFFRPFCRGVSCTSDTDCTAPGFHCLPSATGSNPTTYGARCYYGSQAATAGAVGAPCADSDECASGWCFEEGDATSGTCSAVCATDASCGANQKCAALRVAYETGGPDQALPICRAAAGSRSACEGDVDCPFDEICHTYLVGTAYDGFTTFVGSVDSICTKPVWASGRPAGQPCDPDNNIQCENDLCLTADGGASWFCSALCVDFDDWDCPGSMVCDASLTVWGSGSTAISHMVCTP